jgi:hypothetical protein
MIDETVASRKGTIKNLTRQWLEEKGQSRIWRDSGEQKMDNQESDETVARRKGTIKNLPTTTQKT